MPTKAVYVCICSALYNILCFLTCQTCVCANRIMVQDGVYDKFVDKFAKAVEKELVVGDGFDGKTTQGPLINKAALTKVGSPRVL